MGRNLKKIVSGILLVSMLSVAGCNKDERNESKNNDGVSVEDTKKENIKILDFLSQIYYYNLQIEQKNFKKRRGKHAYG